MAITLQTSTTDNRCYIVGLRNLEALQIQFVPKEIEISRIPNISEVLCIGRNTPFHHYTSGKTELSFQLDFHAERSQRDDVIEKCKWLEMLGYNDGYDNPPESVKIIFGNLFRDEVWTVKSVKYKLTQFDLLYGFLPKQAYVDITFSLDPNYNLTSRDIKWQKA